MEQQVLAFAFGAVAMLLVEVVGISVAFVAWRAAYVWRQIKIADHFLETVRNKGGGT